MVAQIMSIEKGNEDVPAKLTKQVIICSIIAAFAGLMFGYDVGISGTYPDQFLFFFKLFLELLV